MGYKMSHRNSSTCLIFLECYMGSLQYIVHIVYFNSLIINIFLNCMLMTNQLLFSCKYSKCISNRYTIFCYTYFIMKILLFYFALNVLCLAILCEYRTRSHVVLCSLYYHFEGDGLGCINQICESNAGNSVLHANCSVHRQHCGSYGGKRQTRVVCNPCRLF